MKEGPSTTDGHSAQHEKTKGKKMTTKGDWEAGGGMGSALQASIASPRPSAPPFRHWVGPHPHRHPSPNRQRVQRSPPLHRLPFPLQLHKARS